MNSTNIEVNTENGFLGFEFGDDLSDIPGDWATRSRAFETANNCSQNGNVDVRIDYLRQQLRISEEIKRAHMTNPFLRQINETSANVPEVNEAMANVPQPNNATVNVPRDNNPFTTISRYHTSEFELENLNQTSRNPFLNENPLEEGAMYNQRNHNLNDRRAERNFFNQVDANVMRNGPRQGMRTTNVNQDQNNIFNDYNVRFRQQPNQTFDNRYRLNFGDLVPEFDPSKTSITAKKWLSNIENLAKLYVSDEQVLLHHSMIKLKGAAKFWFDGLSLTQYSSWSIFKYNLIEAFPSDKDEADIHFTLSKRRQKISETFEEYFYETISIARRGNISDKAIVKYVIMGLFNDELKRSLSVSRICSLNELLEKVKWAENFKIQDTSRNQKDLLMPVTGLSSRRPPLKCFNCNQLGHISINCKEKPRLPRCTKCNRSGHDVSKCFITQPQIEKPIRHVMEQQEEEEVMKPFFLRTCVDTSNILCLIDTGSPINLLKEKIVKSKRHLLPNSDHFNYTGINKSKLELLGIIYLPTLIYGIPLEIKFHVVPDATMDVDCVLGGEFFNTSDIQVDINGSSGEVFVKKRDQDDKTTDTTKQRQNFFLDLCHINVENDSSIDVDIGDSGTTLHQNELVMQAYNDYISADEPDLPEIQHTMTICVTKEQPFYFSPRRYSFKEQNEINEIVKDLLQKDIIRESTSPYSSRIVLQNKKDGTKRMCIDFREINKRTVRDVHPLPLIDDQLDQLRGKRYFSLIDLKSGFHQVNLDEDSRKYTAFVTASGQYEYKKVPFGLCNGPAVFTRFINHVLKPLLREKLIQVYIDDILLGTETIEEHLRILKELFNILRLNKLTVQVKKCQFLKTKIDFLGYEVSAVGIKPSNRHIEAVQNFPTPKNVHELYRFIGLTSFFRKFIRNHSVLAKPLYDLIRKDAPFNFGVNQIRAFELLKDRLVTEPVLRIYNPSAETELHTDASSLGFGGCLLQKQADDGQFHPIMFFSKRTTDAESKYHSFELETAALIYSLKRFRVYLHGIKFTVVTDCNALKQTLAKQELNAKIARWALELHCYDYVIEHRNARQMQHVDALSRNLNVMVLEEGCFEQTLAFHQMKDKYTRDIKDKLHISENKLFELKDGLVYRKVDGRLLFCVPDPMQTAVITKNHDEAGHVGIDKVIERIQGVYWFPDLRSKVKRHIENCLKCITFNPKYGRKEGWLHPISKGNIPFNTVHIDHLGPLEKTPKGYRYVLLVTDAFTKYVKIFPTKTTNANEAIDNRGRF